jgi:hypothetical protein
LIHDRVRAINGVRRLATETVAALHPSPIPLRTAAALADLGANGESALWRGVRTVGVEQPCVDLSSIGNSAALIFWALPNPSHAGAGAICRQAALRAPRDANGCGRRTACTAGCVRDNGAGVHSHSRCRLRDVPVRN